MKPIARQKLNIVIDILMLVVMVVLAVIGFLIRYVLLSGTMRWEKFGRNVEMTFLGLDRHQWGYIHLIIGISLVVLLILHIVFHWAQMVCMVKRLLPVQPARAIMVTSLALVCSSVFIIPIIIGPEIGNPIRGRGEGYDRVLLQVNEKSGFPVTIENEGNQLKDKGVQEVVIGEYTESQHDHGASRLLEIKGYHTIGGLAGTYNISAGELKQRLNIPVTVSDKERLGRIRRLYGFTMREVEDCILELQSTR